MTTKADMDAVYPPMEGCEPLDQPCHWMPFDFQIDKKVFLPCFGHSPAAATGPHIIAADLHFRERVLALLDELVDSAKYKGVVDTRTMWLGEAYRGVRAAILHLNTNLMDDALRRAKGDDAPAR